MSYSNMKAQKVSRKKLDTDIEISRSSTNKAKRSLSKLGISWICIVVALVVGLAGGYFVSKLAFANDTFCMNAYANGETEIYIGADEPVQTYTEQGVTCIAFGKDISADCTITYYYREDQTTNAVKIDKVDENVAGFYYAVYTTSSIKYSSVTLIRDIIVLGEEQ